MENTANIATTYGLKALASVPANIECEAEMRECRIIIKDAALKAQGKCSQYCQLPEVTEGKVQAFLMNPQGLEAMKDFIASLEDKKVRQVYVEHHRSSTSADLNIESLAEIASLAAAVAAKAAVAGTLSSIIVGICLYLLGYQRTYTESDLS